MPDIPILGKLASATTERILAEADEIAVGDARITDLLGYAPYSTAKLYSVGDCVTYGGRGYRCKTKITSAGAWDGTKWEALPDVQTQLNRAGAQGPQGPAGATPSFSIGSVRTLPPGSGASVTLRGTAEAPVLDFGIPRGADGLDGSGSGGGGTVSWGDVQNKPFGRYPQTAAWDCDPTGLTTAVMDATALNAGNIPFYLVSQATPALADLLPSELELEFSGGDPASVAFTQASGEKILGGSVVSQIFLPDQAGNCFVLLVGSSSSYVPGVIVAGAAGTYDIAGATIPIVTPGVYFIVKSAWAAIGLNAPTEMTLSWEHVDTIDPDFLPGGMTAIHVIDVGSSDFDPEDLDISTYRPGDVVIVVGDGVGELVNDDSD